MIGTYCEPEFIAKIDAARGFKSRSQFCREAIREALQSRGVEVPEKEIMPRDTTGRPRKHFSTSENPFVLNESHAAYRATESPAAAASKPPAKPSKKTPQNPTS